MARWGLRLCYERERERGRERERERDVEVKGKRSIATTIGDEPKSSS